eukprot:5271541-Amphidinium_carterae.1
METDSNEPEEESFADAGGERTAANNREQPTTSDCIQVPDSRPNGSDERKGQCIWGCVGLVLLFCGARRPASHTTGASWSQSCSSGPSCAC